MQIYFTIAGYVCFLVGDVAFLELTLATIDGDEEGGLRRQDTGYVNTASNNRDILFITVLHPRLASKGLH